MFHLHHVLKVGDLVLAKVPICCTRYLSVIASLQSQYNGFYLVCDKAGIMSIPPFQRKSKGMDRLKPRSVRRA